MRTEPCWGCGALVPLSEGSTHPYIGASAGCWAVYEALLARQYQEGSPSGQMLVDAYAAQHPGVPGPQAGRSVAVHLMSLCAQIERGLPAERATDRLHVYLRPRNGRRPTFEWLTPPPTLGDLTVQALAQSASSEFSAGIEAWAHSVWQAWREYHPRIRAWLDLYS